MQEIVGKKTSEKILSTIQTQISERDVLPGFSAILIGDDPASEMYVKLKEKQAKYVGMQFSKYAFQEEASEEEVLECISWLNSDKDVHGILVQLPLPKKFSTDKILSAVTPEKDVDGLGEKNKGSKGFMCPFVRSMITLLEEGISESPHISREDDVVILVNSQELGISLESALEEKGYIKRKIISGKDFENNLDALQKASMIITAMGKPKSITKEMVKNDVIIIDGSIEKVGDVICGDVDTQSFSITDARITPVPGGVGPVTVACLIENTWEAFLSQGK